MNAEEFVRLISKLQRTDKAFSLGTVSQVSGNSASIKFDGESSPSGKYYHSLAPYIPVSGHRILIANVAGTHVILGQIRS